MYVSVCVWFLLFFKSHTLYFQNLSQDPGSQA